MSDAVLELLKVATDYFGFDAIVILLEVDKWPCHEDEEGRVSGWEYRHAKGSHVAFLWPCGLQHLPSTAFRSFGDRVAGLGMARQFLT